MQLIRCYQLLVVGFILSACGADQKSEDTKSEVTESSAEVQKSSDEDGFPASNAYADKMSITACESMSMVKISEIMTVAQSDIKQNFSEIAGNVSCGWGYYPSDNLKGLNIRVSPYTGVASKIKQMWASDLKNINDPAIEAARVEKLQLDLEGDHVATWNKRQSGLTVYLSNADYVRFDVGPTMKNSERLSEHKSIAIALAEAYFDR